GSIGGDLIEDLPGRERTTGIETLVEVAAENPAVAGRGVDLLLDAPGHFLQARHAAEVDLFALGSQFGEMSVRVDQAGGGAAVRGVDHPGPRTFEALGLFGRADGHDLSGPRSDRPNPGAAGIAGPDAAGLEDEIGRAVRGEPQRPTGELVLELAARDSRDAVDE